MYFQHEKKYSSIIMNGHPRVETETEVHISILKHEHALFMQIKRSVYCTTTSKHKTPFQ